MQKGLKRYRLTVKDKEGKETFEPREFKNYTRLAKACRYLPITGFELYKLLTKKHLDLKTAVIDIEIIDGS